MTTRAALIARTASTVIQKMVLEQAGSHFARHLEAWHKLAQGKKTLIILIGGASGVGKSTAATLLAARLNITRTQSTDMLREVLRTLRSSAEAPSFTTQASMPGKR